MACSFRHCWKMPSEEDKRWAGRLPSHCTLGANTAANSKRPWGCLSGPGVQKEVPLAADMPRRDHEREQEIHHNPELAPWLENGRNLLKQFSEHEEIAAASYAPSGV